MREDKPGVLSWPVSPSTFKKGANSGGRPDSSDRVQPRRKSQGLKASNSRPSPTRAKEKPAGLSRASGLHLRCERGTEALGIFDVTADIFSAEPVAALWDWTLAIGPPGKAWRPTVPDRGGLAVADGPQRSPSPRCARAVCGGYWFIAPTTAAVIRLPSAGMAGLMISGSPILKRVLSAQHCGAFPAFAGGCVSISCCEGLSASAQVSRSDLERTQSVVTRPRGRNAATAYPDRFPFGSD